MSAPEYRAPTAPPQERPPLSDELALVLVDQSQDARDFARDQADARLTQELNEGGRFRRLVKGIWKGNIAKDYYRQKYIREAQGEIEATQDVLTYHEATPEQRGRAMTATIERFQSEFDEAIHTDAGEQRMEHENNSEIATGLKDLIRQYAEGQLDDETLLEERTRVIEAYREAHGDEALGAGVVRIDNILDVARAVRGAVEHGESADRVIAGMRVISGEARSGVRTEAHYDKIDRAIDRLGRSKIGSLVGPEVTAAAVTTAASLLRLGSHKVVGALAMTVAPGLAAGFWAGLREKKRVKDERAQHAREMAMGDLIVEGSKRREQMEETRYHTAPAQELTDVLNERFGGEDGLDTNEALQRALDELSAVEMRITMSDQRNMDLISYSSALAVEEERLALDIARSQAKTVLEQRLDAATRQQLGLDEDMPLQELLDERTALYVEGMEYDISRKDEAFKKLSRRRIAKAAATGVATGLLFGMVAQEGIAALSDTRQGLVEQLWGAHDMPIDGEQHQTLAYGLVHGDSSHDITVHHNPSHTFDTSHVGERGEYSVSDDHSLVTNHDGTVSLVDKTGHTTINHLPVNPDGSLPPDSIATLQHHGMVVENLSHMVDQTTTEQQTVPVDQFIADHPDQTTHIARDLWYDNNTPAPVFDKNELDLQWANGGVQQNGDIHLSVAGMDPAGSYHDGQSVNWANAADGGELKLAISATSGTQANVFMVDINPDGTINVPHDGLAAQFFSEQNGQPMFEGRYAEVVQVTGADANGVEHVRPLATLVGAGKPDIQATVQVHHSVLQPDYKITTGGYDTTEQQSTFTEMAPVIPVIPRRSLENLAVASVEDPAALTGRERAPYGYRAGGEYLTERERVEMEDGMSQRLLENPDADLNPYEELHDYRERVRSRRGDEYVRSIDQAIAASPELSNLPSNLRTIVKIPVKASGQMEADKIYDVLTKAYAGQDKEALDEALILLHVNWYDTAAADPEESQRIAKTRAEIARAKADYPDLNIAVIETEWKHEDVKDGVIGHVARRLNDAALFAVEAAMEKGNIERDQDILLIRNDADPKGVSEHYLKRFNDEAQRNPETDIFTGTTSFDNTKADRAPGFVMAANFMQSLDLLATRAGRVHTGGANFAVRASTFAAVGCTGFADDINGAGTDDVNVGRRVSYARSRKVEQSRGLSGYFRGARVASYRGAVSTTASKRKVAKRVVGARIDTDSDREEVLYQRGKAIVRSWDPEEEFDKNGHKNREEGLQSGFRESVANEPEVVLERLRHDMEDSINISGTAVGRAGLAFMFSTLADHSSTEAYNLKVVGHDAYGNPIHRLDFTDLGRQEVVKRLTRDSKGRFDSYGSRKLRQMYGEAKANAKRQPQRRPMIRV